MKSIFKSRTFWLNAVTAALVWLDQNQNLLSPTARAWVPFILTAANIAMRYITKDPVKIL